MPAEDGVGGHDGADLGEELATQSLPPHRQAAPLAVVEQEPPVAELLPEHAVLLPQVLDGQLLARLSHPASRAARMWRAGCSIRPDYGIGAAHVQVAGRSCHAAFQW